MTVYSEPAPAKLNLALHVRGKMPDGRHRIETIFAFCCDGDVVEAETADRLSLAIGGPFADQLSGEDDNMVLRSARMLRESANFARGAAIHLKKKLPVASGIGGGSADAAATLRLLTRLWRIDPAHSTKVAPFLGSDVPACLLSMTARGEGAGDELRLIDDERISGAPAILVNPGGGLSTSEVFSGWDGTDRGPLDDWMGGRNDLEAPALALRPQIAEVLDWLKRREGVTFARMSGSGATCFALFDREQERDSAAAAVPGHWWHLATILR